MTYPRWRQQLRTALSKKADDASTQGADKTPAEKAYDLEERFPNATEHPSRNLVSLIVIGSADNA